MAKFGLNEENLFLNTDECTVIAIMKVIPFPGTCKAEPNTTTDYKLHQGPVNFTCPHCKHSQEATFNNMIFRSVEFHCGGCGTFFKVVNPAFSTSKKKP